MALKGQLGETMQLNARGTAALGDLAFSDGDRPVLTVGRIETVGLDYTWPATATHRARAHEEVVGAHRAAAPTAPCRSPRCSPRRARRRARPPPGARATGGPPPPAAADPGKATVTVREAIFEDGSATIVDAAVSPPARLEVAGVRLAARDFQWPARGADPGAARHAHPGRPGRSPRRASSTSPPGTIEAQVTPSGVDLVTGAALPAGARADRGQGERRPPGQGHARAARDHRARRGHAGRSGRWPTATGRWPPPRGSRPPGSTTRGRPRWWSRAARLQKPWAQIERAADGSFPIIALLTPAPPAAAGGTRREPPAGGRRPAPTAPSPSCDVRVRRVAVEDGVIAIVDWRGEPAAGASSSRARASRSRTSPGPRARPSQVKLRTETATGGHLEAQGQLRVDTQAVDMQIAAKQLDLATDAGLPALARHHRGQDGRRPARARHAGAPGRRGHRPPRLRRPHLRRRAAHARLHQARGRGRARRGLAAPRDGRARGHRQALAAPRARRRRHRAAARRSCCPPRDRRAPPAAPARATGSRPRRAARRAPRRPRPSSGWARSRWRRASSASWTARPRPPSPRRPRASR